MVASAHGDFRSLLKNPKLNTLVGGKTSVTVGDGMAIANGGSKVGHPGTSRLHFSFPSGCVLVQYNPQH